MPRLTELFAIAVSICLLPVLRSTAVERSPLVLFSAQSGRPGEADVVRTLEDAAAAGYSDLMVYARSGLEYTYMGEDWLTLVGWYLEHARRRGMHIWLYDEFNWPSGSCRGQVFADGHDSFRLTTFGVYAKDDGTYDWRFFRAVTDSANVYDVQAMNRFRALTHEVYEKRFRPYFGTTIRGIFTDEPGSHAVLKMDPDALAAGRWYPELEEDYRKRTGRDFRSDIEAWIRDRTKSRVWADYTDILACAFRRAFTDPVTRWCDRLGVVSTGHLMSESDPFASALVNGRTLHVLKGMSKPCIDEIFTRVSPSDTEWLTLAAAQHAIGRTGRGGGAELFALGPCDLPFGKMRQMIWLTALHKVDTYFMSLHHQTARGFVDKPHYAMFMSPVQPWFFEQAEFHDAAREASSFARKPFVCDVAVRDDERTFGRIARASPPGSPRRQNLVPLLAALGANQVAVDLYEEDESCAKPVEFAFEGETIVERRSGRRFGSPAEAVSFVRSRLPDAWHAVEGDGRPAGQAVLRRYEDGTAVILNLTDRDRELEFRAGDVRVPFRLPSRGVWIYRGPDTAGDLAPHGRRTLDADWSIRPDRPNRKRIRFLADGSATLRFERACEVRFALCALTNALAQVTLDGNPLVPVRPCSFLGFGYDGDYAETDTVRLGAGTHVFRMTGREDRGLFLPVLWMEGDFATERRDRIVPVPENVPAGPLAENGFSDYSGRVTYTANVQLPAGTGPLVLGLDTGNARASVAVDGRDLGARPWAPFEWRIPSAMRGRTVTLDVTLTTSVRPLFGEAFVPGMHDPRIPRWVKTIPPESRTGLCGAWLAEAGPELLFRATFDGTPEAVTAKGASVPLEATDLAFAPGVKGEALRFSAGRKSVLAYAQKGNLVSERGTISLWTKNEWTDLAGDDRWGLVYRYLIAQPRPKPRNGSGALYFRWIDRLLRVDQSDDADSHQAEYAYSAMDGGWHHLAWTWDEQSMAMYVDGRKVHNPGDSHSPLVKALKEAASPVKYRFSCRKTFDRFFVGSDNGSWPFEGLIDDLRIYSAPLSGEAIAALAREHAVERNASRPDYAGIYPRKADNPYSRTVTGDPGVIPADDLELVDEVTVGSPDDVAMLRTSGRFSSVGDLSYGSLGKTGYLEADGKTGSRFAFRFRPPAPLDPFYVIDIDYPDDKVRTADVLVHPAKKSDYSMQCGFAAGGEYASTRRILTHRVVWWAKPGDIAVVLMTARKNAPAAVSAIRFYRVKGRRLPAVSVREPKEAGGWRRTLALYYEDPAIGADFGVPDGDDTPESIGVTIDRTIATMRFAGENMLAYPGAFYHGLIDEGYNPRRHAPDFLSAWYVKFDREGDLYMMPTLNVNNIPVPEGTVTAETMTNGALHATAVAIHDTGKPNPGRWHGTPPNFNIAHPDVQSALERMVDALLEQGVPHPSFKGIAVHAPRHSLATFGGIESGYNDYCIDAFEKAYGLKVPRDRSDPLRGASAAVWIRANAMEQWLDWRCDTVTAFWGRIARKLLARRSDLKLWINSYGLSYARHKDWAAPEFVRQQNLEMGLDGAKLTAAAPNLILSQCIYPADPRWRGPGYFRGNTAAWEKMQAYHAQKETYRLLEGADFPWVGQHDRYWETAIGRSKTTLSCDWLAECRWRVSTINPSDVHALRHFVVPLRHNDVLGMSKGGFLIGTYGMEPYLARFARAFRALPAVKMADVFRSGNTVARQAPFDGRSYFYVVNTDPVPVKLTVRFPADTTDLATGTRLTESVAARTVELDLGPYELRSFTAPEGSPEVFSRESGLSGEGE